MVKKENRLSKGRLWANTAILLVVALVAFGVMGLFLNSDNLDYRKCSMSLVDGTETEKNRRIAEYYDCMDDNRALGMTVSVIIAICAVAGTGFLASAIVYYNHNR